LRALLPVAWVLFLFVPTSYAVAYFVEGVFEVPLREESFRFERPWAALLLLAVPLVLAARAYVQRGARPRLLFSRVRDLAMAGPGRKLFFLPAPMAMRVTAVALLGLALMGPQSIHARDQSEVEGIDIVLTLDMSGSMQASDIRPDRFSATQAVVDSFVRRRPNDRIGAVVFGRDAYTLMPLTTDNAALREAISQLQLGAIDGQGTAIGNALGTSLNRLRRSHAKSKVVILLTDGDSNSGNITPDQAAELAQTIQVKVFSILMGQSDEAQVQRGRDLFGNPLWDRGSFPVNPELLRGIAQSTGGEYFSVSDRAGLERSFHTILDRLEKSEIEDAGRVYGELYPAFAWPALVLLLLEALTSLLLLRRWP
jgi:Ca-activated chloride channel family protein